MTATVPTPPAWFDRQHYAGTERLDFEGWRTQIGSRIFLASLLELRSHEQFDQHFAELQRSPFMDLGFADNYFSGRAVYPLTYGVAESIVSTLAPLCPHRRDSCDLKLLEDGQASFGMQAHLTVDFNASETEIVDDFKVWLASALPENRQRFPRPRRPGITVSVIKSWTDFQVLPYQDLFLWHHRMGQPMPSQTVLAAWLFAEQDGDKDKAGETKNKAEAAFKLSILRQLALADERPIQDS